VIECVYCAVRAESLYTIPVNLVFEVHRVCITSVLNHQVPAFASRQQTHHSGPSYT